jgi:bacterioferritin B
MAAGRFVDQLNEQVRHEFTAAQQYIANAVFYDGRTLPRLAAFFYAQALEERNHALMMVRYLLDSGATPVIPGVSAPIASFENLVAPVVVALEQESRVTDQISALTAVARDEGDYQSEGFMQWFLKEQTEEVSTMSDLLAVARRNAENPENIEEFLAREHPHTDQADPTAPPVAGGAV